jgi:bacillithiol biosynthesis cysteine-adding enzyme BshC
MAEIIQEIPLQTIPGFSKLVGQYLLGNPELKHLYKYDFNIDAFEQVIADKSKDDTDRELLVRVLKKQYADVTMSERTMQNIELLNYSNTFTITAAHQPCVLLGPVFNIYKIASTINLANQLKVKYPDHNFVPIFWMGSEDHDFEELGTTYIYGKKITWPASEGEAGAYGRRKTQSLYPVLEEALAVAGEAARPLIDKLRGAIERFPTFGPYTRYLINELFGETGLVVIDQDDADLKLHFSSVILDELKNSSAIKAMDSTMKWLESNYSVQATPRDINLFYLGDNSRERIIRTADGYEVNNTGLRFPPGVLEEIVTNKPEVFSPNVILRPLYQELILPNLAFIGGAAEVSYWMELKAVFEQHKINYPMLIMRSSMTMINSGIEKKMNKLGLSATDFFGSVDQLINSFVKSKLSDDIQFDEEKKTIAAMFDSFVEKAEKVDPTLKAAVLAEKQKQLTALDAIEGKIIKAEKRKQEESVNQIKALSQIFSPNQSWQERTENFIPFYLRDSNFINETIKSADPFRKSMLIINQDN